MAKQKTDEIAELGADEIFPDVDRIYTPEELHAAVADLASIEDKQVVEEPLKLEGR